MSNGRSNVGGFRRALGLLVPAIGALTIPGCQSAPPKATPVADKGGVADRTVAVFHRTFPDAVLDDVVRPEGFGGGSNGRQPLYWVCRFHIGDRHREVEITPDGIVIRKEDDVTRDQLPAAVARAVEGASANAAPKAIRRQETRAHLMYVAIDRPEVLYVAAVKRDGKATHLAVAADGTMLRSTGGAEAGEKGEENGAPAATPAPNRAVQEIATPDEAAKAVRAVKKVYPHAIVHAIEDVPYDDGTGRLQMLYYEVECSVDGKDKEVHATPDGLVLNLDRPLAAKDLPSVVAAAISKEIPGGTITSVSKQESRGDLRFVALDRPRVIYLAEFSSSKKDGTLRFAPDGKKVERFNPWGDR